MLRSAHEAFNDDCGAQNAIAFEPVFDVSSSSSMNESGTRSDLLTSTMLIRSQTRCATNIFAVIVSFQLIEAINRFATFWAANVEAIVTENTICTIFVRLIITQMKLARLATSTFFLQQFGIIKTVTAKTRLRKCCSIRCAREISSLSSLTTSSFAHKKKFR